MTSDSAVVANTGSVRRAVVLDVPEEARKVHYGYLLEGVGCITASRVALDPVGPRVPLTKWVGAWNGS